MHNYDWFGISRIQEQRTAGADPRPRTDEAADHMRQGPDHQRASLRWWEARQQEREAREEGRPAPPRTELPERATQRSGAGTQRLSQETDWWGGDTNILHHVMQAYEAERRR